MINKTVKKVLKALSYNDVELEKSRSIANIKALDPMKLFHTKVDLRIHNEGHQIPIRIFFPDKSIHLEEDGVSDFPAVLFLHGGGWVTDSVDNYERICARLAKNINQIVIAVEYSLAPEHPFPAGLMDCYYVAKSIFQKRFFLNINPEQVTLMGDSAGGNLAAALSLMARDKKEFEVKRQILIYPAVNSDYSETSPYPSVQENGKDYILTRGRLRDYINLYAGKEEDKENPYFAPIKEKDLTNQPETLIITAELDPLRDEGEDYGKKLKEAGNKVEVHRIKDAPHGFFALGIKAFHVKESFEIINEFLQRTRLK
ncbi:acetyl esterase/lipase [Aequitasia blattaphilus]|uniref:Alpha/beta hydrolase n=1 Tax=Aequitasia blattaphilus TaxID=2949332 RepID=A0ABT1EDD5_9FIRM|nr:alpha/beta hydrolase [Aequitasia blattaphilus]MCP1102861.1 alpha/beta hydrolase [Aequitasia blattaphilus]MCR8615501.1 alpha/beta hydrolase [Aequitasia blattaphilus]